MRTFFSRRDATALSMLVGYFSLVCCALECSHAHYCITQIIVTQDMCRVRLYGKLAAPMLVVHLFVCLALMHEDQSSVLNR